jgi:23S rRNA pseudouridine1911/1915/1917 synthase
MPFGESVKLQMRGEWLELQVPSIYAGCSLRSLLEKHLGMGAKLSYRYISDKRVQLHQKKAGEQTIVEKGDRLLVHLYKPEEGTVKPDPIPIDVIYEDEHITVVNKPAGILVHPNETRDQGTLLHRVQYHFLMKGWAHAPKPIHRLDQYTSGGVLFANHDWSKVLLDEQLRDGKIKREYIALVNGKMKKSKGTLDFPIGKDRHHPTRRRVSPSGTHAVTHYEVLETYGDDASLVRLKLETGKTHQIRVHMSHFGHPLLGDALYGGSVHVANRQALHGERLRIQHPFTDENLELEIPWPEDFRSWVEKYTQ